MSSAKVVQVVNTLAVSDGGPARNAYELHLSMARRWPGSAWIAVLNQPSGPQVNQQGGAEQHGASTRYGLPAALRSAAGSDTVVIHGYYLWWIPVVALASRAFRRKVLLTPHGSLTAYQQRFSVRRKRVFDATAGRIVRACVGAFVLGSESEQTDLAAKFPNVRSVVAGVGTGAVLQESDPSVPTPRGFVIGSLTRIAPKKRLDLVLCTTSALRQRGYDARCVIAGDGDQQLTDELKGLSAQLGLGDAAEFVGRVEGDAKTALFRRFTVFVAPSDDENFGISVAEALAHGVPCVVSQFVASGQGLTAPAGVVVSDRSADGLADAVLELASHPAEDGTTAARRWAEDRYSWDAVAARWAGLIDE